MKTLRPGPFRLGPLAGLTPSAIATVFLVPLNLAISAGFEEIETPPAWTRSSVQPPLVTPVVGRTVSDLQPIATPAGWLRASIPTPTVPGQYFGRTINDPDPLIATPQWLRPSVLPPLVPANITIGGFDRVDPGGWVRGAIQTPTVAAGQPFGQAINVPDPNIATAPWSRGSPQTPVTPSAGQVFGKAISEPYLTIPTPSWLGRSILPPLVPSNISIGGFDDSFNTFSWMRAGGQGPVTVAGITSIVDARHRETIATPSWSRSTPATTPPITVPPAGTVVIGATWPHEAPFHWLNPTPTATPITPVPPAGTALIGATWPHQPAFAWLSPTPAATPATPLTTPPAGTIFIGAEWPHQPSFVWLNRPQLAEDEGDQGEDEQRGGGSWVAHPKRIVYVKGDKRKPKTFIDRIGEPFVQLEKTAEPVPNAASAGPPPVNTAPVRDALVSRIPVPLTTPVSPAHVVKNIDDEDDDLLLLS